MSIQPYDFDGMEKAARRAGEVLRRITREVDAHLAKVRYERTPGEIDAGSVFRYEMAVRRERAEGLAFVKREATRVRKELGL